jgi:hypothetical protein
VESKGSLYATLPENYYFKDDPLKFLKIVNFMDSVKRMVLAAIAVVKKVDNKSRFQETVVEV